MYKGKKQQTGGTQQQIKCVYVVQEKVWRVTVQWGKVNDKGTFFVVAHSIVKDYTHYFDAISEVVKYMNTIYISPAKPVADSENDKLNDKLTHKRYDCLSELDMELAEQYANAREGEH